MKKMHLHSRRCFFSFLRKQLNQRIMIDTISGTVVTGTLVRYTRKAIRLKDVHIISVRGETLFLCYVIEKIGAITAWGLPLGNCPPFIDQQVVTGQITDSNTHDPLVGAFIRIVLIRDDKPIRVLGYTYSGCDGQYMFAFSRSFLLPNDRIQIQIVGPPDSGKVPCLC